MRIGDNEKIVVSLLKKYPKLNNTSLQLLFSVLTGRKARIDSILFSLRVKGILDDETGDISDSEIKLDDNLLAIDKDIIDNIKSLSEPIKFGMLAKSILYVISKTEKSSIQFLSIFFKEKENNIYAILKRLEEKNLIASYISRIRHQNKSGRRFNPKYYVITDFGRLWIRTRFDDAKIIKKIDNLLINAQQEIDVVASQS